MASDLAALATIDLSKLAPSSYSCLTFAEALYYFEENMTSTCAMAASFIQELRMSVRTE